MLCQGPSTGFEIAENLSLRSCLKRESLSRVESIGLDLEENIVSSFCFRGGHYSFSRSRSSSRPLRWDRWDGRATNSARYRTEAPLEAPQQIGRAHV